MLMLSVCLTAVAGLALVAWWLDHESQGLSQMWLSQPHRKELSPVRRSATELDSVSGHTHGVATLRDRPRRNRSTRPCGTYPNGPHSPNDPALRCRARPRRLTRLSQSRCVDVDTLPRSYNRGVKRGRKALKGALSAIEQCAEIKRRARAVIV